MGKYDFRPARVHHTASQLLRSERLLARPPWLEVVANIPPPDILVRTQPVQHTGHRKGPRKPSKLYKPQNISYPEDSLRKQFFSDHPWELARPKVVLEELGKDYQGQEWSSIRHAGGHLSGENVIQRQAWLMEQKNLSKDDAYDQARREFYHERMREDIERRVAKEEAMVAGAYFGRTMISIGNELEDNTFEVFRGWAEKAAMEQEQRNMAVNSGVNTPAITSQAPDETMIPDENPEGSPEASEATTETDSTRITIPEARS